MNRNIICFLLLVLISISCSKREEKNDVENNLTNKNIKPFKTNRFCDCENYIQNLQDNNEVCISGVTNVIEGKVYTYTYTISNNNNYNIKNAVDWNVLFGKITMIKVETEIIENYIISKCTIRIKNNFKYGSLEVKTSLKSLSESVSTRNEVRILIKTQE